MTVSKVVNSIVWEFLELQVLRPHRKSSPLNILQCKIFTAYYRSIVRQLFSILHSNHNCKTHNDGNISALYSRWSHCIVNNSAQIVSTKNRLQPTLMSSQLAEENKKPQWSSDFFLFELLAIKIPSSLSLSLKLTHRGGSVAQERPGELSWR